MNKYNKKILVIDDDPGINEVIEIMLKSYDYEVFTQNNGEGYLKNINKIKPDLILLDLYILGDNGAEMCKKIKENDKTKSIPVIMLSASTQTKQAALESGADGFLFKPFDLDTLVNTVKLMINQKALKL
jgi:DNA-binding response OmpR family regulator